MKLEIILALVLVTTITTLSSAHTLFKRETPTDVEDVENDEEEVGVPAPTEQEEGEDESEHQGAEVSSPVAQLKQAHEVPYDEDEKRGMDVPFQKSSAPCTEWVDRFFKEYLVMHEDRAAEFSDLQRFFMFMDDDADGRISLAEFGPKWMEATAFGETDTMAIFMKYFTMLGDPTDMEHITPRNVMEIWEDVLMADIEGGMLSLEDFKTDLEPILLALPNKACSGVDMEEGAAPEVANKDAGETDIYGYYRKRK